MSKNINIISSTSVNTNTENDTSILNNVNYDNVNYDNVNYDNVNCDNVNYDDLINEYKIFNSCFGGLIAVREKQKIWINDGL